jgi:hypothetical protein
MEALLNLKEYLTTAYLLQLHQQGFYGIKTVRRHERKSALRTRT